MSTQEEVYNNAPKPATQAELQVQVNEMQARLNTVSNQHSFWTESVSIPKWIYVALLTIFIAGAGSVAVQYAVVPALDLYCEQTAQ